MSLLVAESQGIKSRSRFSLVFSPEWLGPRWSEPPSGPSSSLAGEINESTYGKFAYRLYFLRVRYATASSCLRPGVGVGRGAERI